MKYAIAVRALTEFTAKEGDLDLRFTPSPSAQEGIAGHAAVAARRPSSYQREVSLSGDYRHLMVRGRADGFDPERRRLEEIKTYRGDLARMPANHRALHWAQLKIYGWLLCDKLGLEEVELALVYYEIGSGKETVLAQTHAASALRDWFEAQCERFLAWAEREMAHRAERDAALTGLAFPHAGFRSGQRALAEAVYRAACGQRCLLAEAPTGIGKTIGTLFPALKAMPGQQLDKLFYLAAKTSGRKLALDALAGLAASPAAPPLRVLELVARDKACVHPEKACHGESCPLAKGFYDRLPQARLAALDGRLLGKEALREVALAHEVCPYYLSQDLARWSDVVVGDYNYYFDSGAMLHALAAANEWRAGVLADEAHNLVDRARAMYTARLDQHALRTLRRAAPAPLKRGLDRVHRAWNALNREQEAEYQAYETLPSAFSGALQQAVADMGAWMADQPSLVDGPLQEFYFDALHFLRMAETFGTHSLFDLTRAGKASTLCIRNVVPAAFLSPRFAAAHFSVLFSATLKPTAYYTDLLGLPEDTVCIEVDSPFDAAQLDVRIAREVSTRYHDREASLAPIADLIAEQYARRPGNYLAFFSSFDYLQKAVREFAARHPGIPVREQSRGMAEADRDGFLAQFAEGGRGVGFAVLGGVFGEGIDLPGERLVGAFIATLGLPQLNPVNEQIMQRMQATFGAGYDYTYLYPGLQKVVQAAGRVIRTRSDSGVVVLIDDRFARPQVRRLLPGWWKVSH